MNKRQLGFWSMGGLTLIVITSLAWPLIANAKRLAQQSFTVSATYSKVINVQDALDVSAITRNFVVSEGPCGGNGCNGGILSQQSPMDLKELIPHQRGYDGESTSIIWLHQIKPTEITRRNDWFGEDSVTITGVLTKEPKVYFAVVPREIVAPHLQWVYVQTK